jgi:imidazolonepropionase-like amidohydrolase
MLLRRPSQEPPVVTPFECTVRNGTVVTASDTDRADIGIVDGRIAAIAPSLAAGATDIDATGRFVLPGGIDSHCHVEQLSGMGIMCADDFYSASVAAAFGGTTTIVPFAAQHRGMSLPKVVADYHACAGPKAVIDYGFHLIVSDPTEQALTQDLPALIRAGYTSFKVYMTYDMLKLDDGQMLDVLELAGREGALIVENVKTNKDGFGYNVATDKYEDLVKAGVVDPTKVTRTALQNAASIAGLLLTTECMITEIPEKKEAPGGGGHGHGGGGGMDY